MSKKLTAVAAMNIRSTMSMGSPLTPTITIRPKAHDVCKKDLID